MISKEEVENLAQLARIELENDEVAALRKDMSNILEYVGQLTSFKEEKTLEKSLTPENVLREDSEGISSVLRDKREALLKALPKREGEYVLVRKILQKDE